MNTQNQTASVGDTVRIIRMDDNNGKDPQAAAYAGRTGEVTHIDSEGQLHGTWGGLALIPGTDTFEVISGQRQ